MAEYSNHPERLDDALSRPGRFDVHIPFYDATHAQIVSLFKHFYPASSLMPKSGSADDQEVEKADSETAEETLQSLAQSFADKVFSQPLLADDTPMTVSMAALQGFLLGNKRDARMAEEKAGDWVRELWGQQQEKAEKRVEKAKMRGEARRKAERFEPEVQVQEENVGANETKMSKVQGEDMVKLETIQESKDEEQNAVFRGAPPSPVSPTTPASPLPA